MNTAQWHKFVDRLNIPFVAKLEIILYAVVLFIHGKYVLFVGLSAHGFWSWYVWKSLSYVLVSAYMIRFCRKFLRELSRAGQST